jgi:pimeloyl-ACP methyl ester carboxylesterase
LVGPWPLNGDAWEKQVHALVEAGFRAIQYDRRGFGRSDRPASGYGLTALVSDLHALMESLDLRDSVLVGHSMGGAEVARYLSQHGSKRVRRAVYIACINPFLLKTADNPEGIDGSIFAGFQEAILADRPATLAAAVAGMYNASASEAKGISKEKISADLTIAYQAAPQAVHDCIAAWLTDLRRDHESIGIPTLVIHGTADASAPIDATGRRTGLYPNTKMIPIEGAPHAVIWTNAEEVNEAILEFIQ